MQRAAFVAACLIMLATPLAWRGLVRAWGPPAASLPASYLPALEPARVRYPFDPKPIDDLKSIQPGIVLIGDSMSLRIDPERLEHETGVLVARLTRLATGSAHWYLMLKNYVVASGVRPRWVVMFFRDAQLTDPMFRLTDVHRGGADPLSLDREDDLNRVVASRVGNVWFRAHAFVARLYDADPARDWIEPTLTTWVATRAAGPDGHDAFVTAMNARFGLDQLRASGPADIADEDTGSVNFGESVGTSVLPLMLDLAREHDLRLCFVRVLRRPVNGHAPRESPALRRYVADLGQYLGTHGAAFLDDRSVPEYALMKYDDGDHILEEERPKYTDLFFRRLSDLSK